MSQATRRAHSSMLPFARFSSTNHQSPVKTKVALSMRGMSFSSSWACLAFRDAMEPLKTEV